MSNWHTSHIQLDEKASKTTFFSKNDCFFDDLWIHFESLIKWKHVYICHDQRIEKKEIHNE